MEKYKFLFPFEKIPQGSRIVIYGAGDVGQEYLKQILVSQYCKVVSFLDRASTLKNLFSIPVRKPEAVCELQYEYVVVALKSKSYLYGIIDDLTEKGVEQTRIIYQGIRDIDIAIPDSDLRSDDKLNHLAYKDQKCISIALRYGHGIGDAIIHKKFFVELCKLSDMIRVDIYSPNASTILPSIYADRNEINQYVDDGGAIYNQQMREYDLAITVSYLIQIDADRLVELDKKMPLFADKIRKMKKSVENYGLKPFPSIQKRIHIERARYRGYNCYSAYNECGLFDISDMKVEIPLNMQFQEAFENLQLKEKYITINYGNGTARNTLIAKQWPSGRFEELIALLLEGLPDYDIIQLGDSLAETLKGATRVLKGKNLELVKYILLNSSLHIDIEGGLVHIATQLDTKCVVLFGQTPLWYFGYPQNINIQKGECRGCFALCEDDFGCVRDMAEPECMHSITPEYVFEQAKAYLDTL